MKFRYTAMDSSGREKQGSVEAQRESEVNSNLKQLGLFPTSIKEIKDSGTSGSHGTSGIALGSILAKEVYGDRKVKLIATEPLGLPTGSVRALIALSIIIFSMVFFMMYQKFPTELVSLMGVVVGYYFGARNSETNAVANNNIIPPNNVPPNAPVNPPTP